MSVPKPAPMKPLAPRKNIETKLDKKNRPLAGHQGLEALKRALAREHNKR